MAIELRILSGSRAGQSESYEKTVIAIGRHPMSDLRFDANADLDVSTRHGEVRVVDGRYSIVDNQSTNGTFVNGERVPSGGIRELRSGDVIGFGSHGPTVSVRIADSRTTPIGDRTTAALPRTSIGASPVAASAKAVSGASSSSASGTASGARRPTTERVAIAVAEQTRGLKIAMSIGVVVVLAVGAGLYWMGHREATESEAKMAQLVTSYEQSSKQLQSRLEATNDTALINNLRRQRDSLVNVAQKTPRGTQAAVVQQAIQRQQAVNRAIEQMDLPAVRAANNPAVAIVRADIGGTSFEATGFGVTATGGVITNRHAVMDSAGTRATRILVKFADTDIWHPAHVTRVADGAAVDLALIQLDGSPATPVVKGISTAAAVPEGSTIASLGFPMGTDSPMEGLIAKTTLMPGTVSKSVSEVLQIDSYATHGSSGSPVFDARGEVVGVIYAGPREAAGRIVYAVPAKEIRALLK